MLENSVNELNEYVREREIILLLSVPFMASNVVGSVCDLVDVSYMAMLTKFIRGICRYFSNLRI